MEWLTIVGCAAQVEALAQALPQRVKLVGYRELAELAQQKRALQSTGGPPAGLAPFR
jgi:hypothetical protein